jgi:hypothetical protein
VLRERKIKQRVKGKRREQKTKPNGRGVKRKVEDLCTVSNAGCGVKISWSLNVESGSGVWDLGSDS